VRRAPRAARTRGSLMAFVYTQPVRFADVDHAGIVYYPRFFHFFHLAFEELWRTKIGPRAYSALLDQERVGFPAVKAECAFHAPLRFGDTMDIELSITRLGTKSITFRYRIYRAAEADRAREPSAEGTVVCAVVDLARFVSIAVPDHVRELLSDLVEPASVAPSA
jgi:4-hydroxybenzoyl-CoA thioesterase